MLKPSHLFLALAPILSIAAWFLMQATLSPPEPIPLGLELFLSLLLGVVPAALIALFWTMLRGLLLPKPSLELVEGEVLVGHAPANHRIGAEMRGGRIFITSHALHFLPHRFNVQLESASMPWDEVRLVDLIQQPMGSKLTLHSAQGEMDINMNARSLSPQDFQAVIAAEGQARIAALQALRFAPPQSGQRLMQA